MQRMFTFDLDLDDNKQPIGILDCYELAENNTCEQILEDVHSPERGCYYLLTDDDQMTYQQFAQKVLSYIESEKHALVHLVKKLHEALKQLKEEEQN
jgi:hypothetical protein